MEEIKTEKGKLNVNRKIFNKKNIGRFVLVGTLYGATTFIMSPIPAAITTVSALTVYTVIKKFKLIHKKIVQKIKLKLSGAKEKPQDKESLEGEIENLKVKKDELYDDRLNGVIDVDRYKELAAKIDAEIEELRARIAQLEKEEKEAEAEEEIGRRVK